MVAEVIEQLSSSIDAINAIALESLRDDELDALVIGLHRAGRRLAGATAASFVPLGRSRSVAI